MKKMNKYILLLTGVFTLFLTLFFFYPRLKQQSSEALTVGMFVWAPFMSINSNGDYEGFDVDVANELARRMNRKLDIKDLGFLTSCFIALEQNKIDLIISDLDITEQRLQKLVMVPYFGQEVKAFSLLFWNYSFQNLSTPTYIHSKNQLNDRIILFQ